MHGRNVCAMAQGFCWWGRRSEGHSDTETQRGHRRLAGGARGRSQRAFLSTDDADDTDFWEWMRQISMISCTYVDTSIKNGHPIYFVLFEGVLVWRAGGGKGWRGGRSEWKFPLPRRCATCGRRDACVTWGRGVTEAYVNDLGVARDRWALPCRDNAPAKVALNTGAVLAESRRSRLGDTRGAQRTSSRSDFVLGFGIAGSHQFKFDS